MKRHLVCILIALTMLLALLGCEAGGVSPILIAPSGSIPVGTSGPGQTNSTIHDDHAQHLPDGSILTVTFLDVGQGDSALLECNGEYMLIDGGETDASSTLYTVLKNREVRRLDFLVATHGHSDHVGGLSGALNYSAVDTALCSVPEYDSKAFANMVKFLGQQGVKLTVPSAGDTFSLGGATVTVLGPIKAYEEPNDTSLVLRIDHGENSFLFTGDMESPAEIDLVTAGVNLDVDVLKVGHHGSSTSTSYRFLREVMPEAAVISCGAGNSYGHPHNETMSKLRDAEAVVYRTDLQGDITCVSDGVSLTWATAKKAKDAELNPTIGDGSGQVAAREDPESEDGYIGNLNSQVVHLPTCRSLPKEANRIHFDTYEEAREAGYRPCGNCMN